MNSKLTLLSGAILAGLGVALGAFGAHALKPTLLANNRLEVYQTAVLYQLVHSLALLFLGAWRQQNHSSTWLSKIAACWVAGIFLFSGSLYGLCLTSIGPFAYATPLGGLLFLSGWVLLVMALLKNK